MSNDIFITGERLMRLDAFLADFKRLRWQNWRREWLATWALIGDAVLIAHVEAERRDFWSKQ